MFEVNEDGKVGGRSLVDFLWGEVVTEVGTCDEMLDERDVGKLEV